MLNVTGYDNCLWNDEMYRNHKGKDNVICVYCLNQSLPKVRFNFAFDDIDR